MEIKEILAELISSKNRYEYLKEFLKKNSIIFKELPYNRGINLEITINGEKEEEIIFFSHYDISIGTTEGANDNSSSVAVLLALLLYLKNKKPFYTLKIVFNDKEEVVGGLVGINGTESNNEKIKNIIEGIGSFDYLKHHCNKDKNQGIFILELSGIGDAVYLSKKSGKIECSEKLIQFGLNVAKKNNFLHLTFGVPYTDMVSVKILGYQGTVIGVIPYYEGLSYCKDKKNYPAIWRNIHSNRDNLFTIQEKSLNLMLNFVIKLIEDLELL